MQRRTLHTLAAGVCLLAVFTAILTISPPRPAAARPVAGPTVRLVGIAADGVTAEFVSPAGKPRTLEAELRELSGKLLAKATGQGVQMALKLPAVIDPKQPANYYLRYRFGKTEKFEQRSLFFMAEIIETTVLGQRDLVAGTKPVVRILVRDRAAGQPLAGAKVSVKLTEKDKPLAEFAGTTNGRGELVAPLAMPDREVKGARLNVNVKSRTGEDNVTETVNVQSGTRTLLATDKPLYQPGQTIHMRALSLRRPSMKALAKADVTFEVEDAKGNKVFKRRVKTDAYGVSHADFVLASELNKGTYRVRAVVAGAKEEKTVIVDRYVLPKFKVKFKPDRQFYQPGDTVRVDLQADYFFGKPVAGAKVQVKCAKFDVAYVDFRTVEGKTDDEGHYIFQVPLPKQFVGQPLEAGKASAKFDITVTDTGDHAEKITRNVSVTGAPIVIMAVPESGDLIGDLENRVYLVTTYADSTPATCKVTWSNPPDGKPVTVKTDAAGFGQVTLTPKKGQQVSMTLSAVDPKGNKGSATVALKPTTQQTDDRILLRTDKSLYRVGDRVKLTVVATRPGGSVYIDVIKDRQTYLTKTLDLAKGRADGEIALAGHLAGTIQINAYLLGANGVMVRDRRLVIADPANDLRIAIAGDNKSYLPGTEAKVRFQVTDSSGQGTAAALGVMVVDEAVFALQEMQPGLEKVYFYLEREIAKPRYEIHGYSLDGCLPRPLPGPVLPAHFKRRDNAARVVLASAKGVGKYSIHVNTHQRDNKTATFQVAMYKVVMKQYQKIQQAFGKYSAAHRKKGKKLQKGIDVAVLIAEGHLKKEDALDPWGGAMKIQGRWCVGCQNYHGFGLQSAGIDGKEGTADDVNTLAMQQGRGRFLGGKGGGMMLERAAVMNGAMPRPAMARAPLKMAAMKPQGKAKAAPARKKDSPHGGEGGGDAPRIREYFPETLYFNPAVITDGAGKATVTIPLADSITTWRMTCMASSAQGELGSTAAGLRVFQDFFVDIDFPVALTQNDEVSVPVVVYNYLKTDQEVHLSVKKADWYELKTSPEKTLKLGPSQVRAVYFPIVAKRIGFQKFTVIGRGTSKSDAVARSVEIIPDGKEYLVTRSARLEGDVEHTITIPPTAIDDASKIFVKIYPGMLSQVVEGLDKMLRMPSGCFEQTSSTTYPNILVMDYMKTTGKITPALQMKAEGFINAGYQRLLSYEVKGGGFDWFGRPPAHRILTAFGLMQFHDMSKVHEVDPAVISRTQRWLAKCQEEDGSYKPSKGGIREGAINKFTDDVFRNTAYITWALASTDYRGAEIDKGIKYLHKHLDEIKDNYTLALTANAFAAVNTKDKTTLAVLDTLFHKRKEDGNLVYWATESATPTHGKGATAAIEVTALAVQAFVRCGRQLGATGKAVGYLAKNKDAYGTWQSTQATIQALRAMLMAERGATAQADAKIQLAFNGKPVKTIKVDNTNSDVLQLVDLKDQTRKGGNTVSLKFAGEGALMYQVVGRYFLPHPPKPKVAPVEPMSIAVKYDRTKLATQDVVGVTATVTNNRRGTAKMVLIDLGLPPGFTLIPDQLNKLVEAKKIEKYSVTGRQIIVYLREVSHGKPTEVGYQLLAKYPLKAKTTKSVVYEYYNPQIRAEAKPIQLTVAKVGG